MSERAPTALVTGGGRGLGVSIARRLAADGWRTVICGRTVDDLDRQVAKAAAEGLQLTRIHADVTDEASVDALFQELTGSGHRLGLVVNNAGANYSHRLVTMGRDGTVGRLHPIDAWESTIRLCLTGVFLVGRRAAEMMLRQGAGGVVVNISSAASSGAYAQSAYGAAKAGVEALTRAWATELGEYGIRVVAVSPGVIDGEALRRRSAANPRHAAYMAALREQIPLRRWCTEEEVADAVAFAASNGAMTGMVMEVDGGGLPRRAIS